MSIVIITKWGLRKGETHQAQSSFSSPKPSTRKEEDLGLEPVPRSSGSWSFTLADGFSWPNFLREEQLSCCKPGLLLSQLPHLAPVYTDFFKDFMKLKNLNQPKTICEVRLISKDTYCKVNDVPNSFKQKQTCLKLKIPTQPFPAPHRQGLAALPKLSRYCFVNRYPLKHPGKTPALYSTNTTSLALDTVLPAANAIAHLLMWYAWRDFLSPIW